MSGSVSSSDKNNNLLYKVVSSSRANKLRESLKKIVDTYNGVYGVTNPDYQINTVEVACQAFVELDVTENEFNIFISHLNQHATWLEANVYRLQNDENLRERFQIATVNYYQPQYSEKLETIAAVSVLSWIGFFGLMTLGTPFLLMTPILPMFVAAAAVILLVASVPLFIFLGCYLGHSLATITADKKNALTDETFGKFQSKLKGVNCIFSPPKQASDEAQLPGISSFVNVK